MTMITFALTTTHDINPALTITNDYVVWKVHDHTRLQFYKFSESNDKKRPTNFGI